MHCNDFLIKISNEIILHFLRDPISQEVAIHQKLRKLPKGNKVCGSTKNYCEVETSQEEIYLEIFE